MTHIIPPLNYVNTIARILPAERQMKVDSALASAMQEYGIDSLSEESNVCSTTFLALGIIVALGGVFLTLAALQILPAGVNAFSSAGTSAQILSYAVLGLGAIMTLIGAVKYVQNTKHNQAVEKAEKKEHEARAEECNHYFPMCIAEDEAVAVYDHDLEQTYCYFWAQDEDKETRPFFNHSDYIDPREINDLEFLAEKTIIDFRALEQRVQQYESGQV